eukprot:5047326-Alexandrium_andersonii.AAC.1
MTRAASSLSPPTRRVTPRSALGSGRVSPSRASSSRKRIRSASWRATSASSSMTRTDATSRSRGEQSIRR